MNWDRGKYVGTPPTSNEFSLNTYISLIRPIWAYKHGDWSSLTNIWRLGTYESSELNNSVKRMHITGTKPELVAVTTSWGKFIRIIDDGMIIFIA